MYSYADRHRAVELYIRLGKRLDATIRQLGHLFHHRVGFLSDRVCHARQLPGEHVHS